MRRWPCCGGFARVSRAAVGYIHIQGSTGTHGGISSPVRGFRNFGNPVASEVSISFGSIGSFKIVSRISINFRMLLDIGDFHEITLIEINARIIARVILVRKEAHSTD